MPQSVVFHICMAMLFSFLQMDCRRDEFIRTPFVDTFDREKIDSHYHNTGGPYRIENGKLRVRGAHNRPLWLTKRLPQNARIEFEVISQSTDGDIKIEAWGDGKSFSPSGGAYLATSYVFVLGGWGNTISALCRMDEHGGDRKERKDVRVEVGKVYRWKIERRGSRVDWHLDGQLFLSFDDAYPLTGDNHSYFGFNNWESDLSFDNLKITPL